MPTDWDLVRTLMASAIDACEAIEALKIQEHERDATGAHGASVADALTSAWVMPERLRYRIIHARHEAGADAPYVPETARVLVHMAQACAELVGAKDVTPAAEECRKAARWYAGHAVPLVRDAIAARRNRA